MNKIEEIPSIVRSALEWYVVISKNHSDLTSHMKFLYEDSTFIIKQYTLFMQNVAQKLCITEYIESNNTELIDQCLLHNELPNKEEINKMLEIFSRSITQFIDTICNDKTIINDTEGCYKKLHIDDIIINSDKMHDITTTLKQTADMFIAASLDIEKYIDIIHNVAEQITKNSDIFDISLGC